MPLFKPSLLLLLGLSQFVLVGSLGCRSTSDNQIDLLERELRVQETYIYELEDYVVEYSEKLRDCRSCAPPQMAVYAEELYVPDDNATLKRTKRSKKSSSRQTYEEKSDLEPVDEPTIETETDDLPSPTESEQTPEISPEDLEVPDTLDFDLDEPVSDLEEARPLQQVALDNFEDNPAGEGMLVIPDPVDFEPALAANDVLSEQQFVEDLFADEEVEATSAVVERVAVRLEVTQLFHGEGDDISPRNGSPRNLLAVVEALDANDEPVDLDGEVSLMVMTTDGSIEGAKPKRLKRWNFSAEETVAAWQSSDLGDGLHLELPLEKLDLPEAPLELWVRLVTTDGRKLLTQLPFETSQLTDIAATPPQPLPKSLSLAETETSAAPASSLRIGAERITKSDQLELVATQQADSQEPFVGQLPTDQPRWRASMQRTDRTSEGFATSSEKNSGWTSQAPGRRSYAPARVASAQKAISRPLPGQSTALTKPVWTSGRAVQTH